MRALIYARFSTHLQSSLSIADQARVCSQLADRQGWAVAGTYSDAAISGAVRDRPGLNDLLAALAPGDVVLSESLDRISRDQEDIAAIFKRVRYVGATIWTLSEGEISELHVGLRGTMAAMVRKDTADKVKRGLTGRALAGMNPGGMAYGYRKVPRFDDRGEPVRGLREIHPDQAPVVVRIFTEAAADRSDRSIAADLNRDGVRSATGGTWRASTVRGLLANPLYCGRLVYNRTRRVYRPGDHAREIRANDPAEWLHVDVPALAIIDEPLWQAARANRQPKPDTRPEASRRPKRLLSGKAVCGSCGGGWTVIATNRWGCSRHRDGRGCSNGRTITQGEFERRVLDGLERKLLSPDLVAAYVDEWRTARRQRLADEAKGRSRLERKQADAERKVQRLVAAIADGLGDVAQVKDALLAAQADAAAARAALADLASAKVVALHPGIAGDYRRRVADLTSALAGDNAEAARHALRALIGRITVNPHPTQRGVDIVLEGQLANLLAAASGGRMLTVVPLAGLGRYHTLLKAAC